jgi:hypothetical protein
MGGSFSKPLNNDTQSLYDEIDYIAADYILTSDFKSLEHLKEKEYCNKLVVLTSDILEKYLAPKDIVFLQQKMKKGFEQPINAMLKDRVAFLKEEEMGDLNVRNSVKKKRLCIGIAKQYVRVAHIFASIVTAINPVYKYTDEQGGVQRVPLYKKNEIPANARATVERFNICENRIKALQGPEQTEGGPIIVAPSICQLSSKPGGETKSLTDEPGIPELMQLYYDKYDYSTGEFVGMTDKTKKVYQAHVDIFNAAFSGATEADPDIKEFADIKLRDYNKKAYCDGNAITSQKRYSSEHATEEEKILFTRYAEHVKEMIANANKNQSELLSIIHELFTQFPDPKKPNKMHYKVNSHLNDVSLEKLVRKTRDLIVKLFTTCENDYEAGVKLYEAIVNTIVIKTTDAQIENMNEVKTELVLGLKPEDVTEPSVEPDQGFLGFSSLNPFAKEEEVPATTMGPDKTTSELIEEENALLTPESPELILNDKRRDEHGNVVSPVAVSPAVVVSPAVEEVVSPTIVEEVPPVLEEVSPVVEEVPPVLEEVSPVIEEVPPVIEEVPPVIEEVPPVIEEVPPVIEEVPPVIEEVPPVIEEVPPVIEEIPPVIEEIPPVIEEVSPVIEEVVSPTIVEEPVSEVVLTPVAEPISEELAETPAIVEEPVVLNKEDETLLKKEEESLKTATTSGGRKKTKKRKQSKKKKQTKRRKGIKGRKTKRRKARKTRR